MPTISLTELQRDALVELFNIGIGRAAATVSVISREEVKLSVPSIELLSRLQASTVLTRTLHQTVWSVSQKIRGAFDAQALLIFPESSSIEIAQMMIQDTLSDEEVRGIYKDALLEVSNIIINACIGSITNILNVDVSFDIPELVVGSCGNILQAGARNAEAIIMLIRIRFEIASRNIKGYLAFIQDELSTGQLMAHVDSLIKSI